MIWRRLHKSTKEQEEKFDKDLEETGLEKGDLPAMLISAFLTIVLPAALFLIGLVCIVMLLFRLF